MIRFVKSAMEKRTLVFVVVGLFLAFGVYVVGKIPIDAVPDITQVQVMINTKTGPLSPEQIERQVTFPIENEVMGVPGVEEVRSLSKYGLSQVTVVFAEGTDIYWARQQIFEKFGVIQFPKGVAPELAPITTGLGEVVMYTVEANSESPLRKLTERERLMKLRNFQEYLIRPELRRIKGVVDVDTNGGYRREVHINLFPDKMKQQGVTVLQLKNLLMSLGESEGGGYIEENGQQIIVGLKNSLPGLQGVSEMPLKIGFDGRPVRVKDIADVRIESGLRVGAATADGAETVLGTVLMRSGANSRQVAKDAVAKIQEISLPEGAEIKVRYSRTYLVDATIKTVEKNLLEGAILVILVLFFLLGDIRASLIVAMTIPFSMIGAFVGMHWLGLSANLMSLGAIDFGLIVDGSVVLVENFVRRSGTAGSLRDRVQFFFESTQEVVKPIFFGILIIMLVYVPILFLGGTEGKMFRPMAITVLLALGVSLLFTLFVAPAISISFLKVDHAHKTPLYVEKLEKFYGQVLQWGLANKKWIFAPVFSFLVGAVFLMIFKVGSDFIPQLDEKDLVIGLVRPAQQSLTTSIEWQRKAEQIIGKYPEVESVFSRMGTPDSATDPMSANFADTFVILKKDYKEGRSKTDVFESMSKELEALTEQDISPTQPIEMRFNEILEGSRADVTLRIYGPDLEVLSQLIDASKEALVGMPGLIDAQYDSLTALTKSPVMEVIPKPAAFTARNVSQSDIKDIFGLAMGGERVGSYTEADKTLPIIMHLDESLRGNRKALLEVPVDVPGQGHVNLGSVADLRSTERVTTIARSWGQRYSALSLFVKDRDIQSFVQEAQERVNSAVKLPAGYKFYWGGQFKNMIEARKRLSILVPITMLLVLLLLYKNFGSWREAFLVFGSIPFAMIGGVFALWLRGMNMTVPASIGFIALAGVAVLNGVVMVTYIADLIRSGVPADDAVLQGARLRLRPVLMTALVASLGFIPMALNSGVGAEVQRPLATVVIGGIISATVLTLLVLPLIYRMILKIEKGEIYEK